MNAMIVLAFSIPTAVTIVTLASLRFAKRVILLTEDERCPSLTQTTGHNKIRCHYKRDHDGPHYAPETASHYEAWWD